MDTLGKRIKAIRLKLGLSLEEFGKNFNPPASKGLVGNWEKDRNKPNNTRLAKIAKLGGITLEELLLGDLTKKNIEEVKKEYKQYLNSVDKGKPEYKAFQYYDNQYLDETLKEFLSWFYSIPDPLEIDGLGKYLFYLETYIFNKYTEEIKTNQNLIETTLNDLLAIQDNVETYSQYKDTQVQVSLALKSSDEETSSQKKLNNLSLIAHNYEDGIDDHLQKKLLDILETSIKKIEKLKKQHPDSSKKSKQMIIVIDNDTKKVWSNEGGTDIEDTLHLSNQEKKEIISLAQELITKKIEKDQ